MLRFDLKTWQAIVAIIAGSLASAAAIWKVVLPAIRRIFLLEVVYEARIAELQQRPPSFVGFQIQSVLQPYVPLPSGFPAYSDWSRERPNWPSRARTDNDQFFEKIKQSLSGSALIQARRWERNVPQELNLLGIGFDSDPQKKLFQTYVRLRWFFLERANSDYSIVEREIGRDCANALRELDSALKNLENRLPTRILILRVVNRGSKDARDLRIDVSAGGEIYDVSMNEQREASIQENTSSRYIIAFPVLQPHYQVDLKIWYKWEAVCFGERNCSQFDAFPGREGILINFIGYGGGRARPVRNLMKKLNAWQSMGTEVGPEPGIHLPGQGF